MSKLASIPKVIFHIDGDAFFVGVEIAKNPKLKGLPVVTGEERGIVSALSYEAKALGVVRGMPIFRLKKLFPNVIVLPGDYRSYVRYSAMMFDIVRRYAYGVEEYSIDECFADFTGLDRTLKMSYRHIAQKIKKEINDELGVSVSVGLAPTKVLAKVASNWQKPNGLTIIESRNAHEFLKNLPIEKIWGIGPKTAKTLIRKGVLTAIDLRNQTREWVKKTLSKPYETIWLELNSASVLEIDIRAKATYSSIQKTRTFHPTTNDKSFLWAQISKHTEDACAKARRYGLVPKKITIFLKDKDFKFRISKNEIAVPTNSPEMLATVTHPAFDALYRADTLYRSTGVVLSDLMIGYLPQNDLFGGNIKTDKFAEIHKYIDALEAKLGKHLVYPASAQKAINRKIVGTDANDADHGDLLFL